MFISNPNDTNDTQSSREIYDVAIIGGGPAGITAALYANNCRLKTIIFLGDTPGGTINTTDKVVNYPATPNISGSGLAVKLLSSLTELEYSDITLIYDRAITIHKDQGIYSITDHNNTYRAETIVLCTGSNHKKLEIESKKIKYCAVCDGIFFSNRDVVVVGGGNAAVCAAIYLSSICSNVYVVYRKPEFTRPYKELLETMFSKQNIHVMYNSNVTNADTSVTVYNHVTNSYTTLDVDAVFVYIGSTPNTDIVKHLIKLHDDASVVVDNKFQTSDPNIYAAGDVIGDNYHYSNALVPRYKQITVANSEATQAILHLNEQRSNKNKK
jgi:thioredoxin reductase (NADPH)